MWKMNKEVFYGGIQYQTITKTNLVQHCTKKELKIAVKNGFIIVDEIKLSGKRKMDVKSLLNGFTFSTDAKFI